MKTFPIFELTPTRSIVALVRSLLRKGKRNILRKNKFRRIKTEKNPSLSLSKYKQSMRTCPVEHDQNLSNQCVQRVRVSKS